uniref:phosphatidylinositol-3,5-bisphosphate 3-phosphatase n=1 Tax=Oncorhynchus tshawytscha TaxID=74940 RepID=A0A8C8HSP8_ONCTS
MGTATKHICEWIQEAGHLALVPFPALQGEGVEYLGRADDTIIAISNYRLHIKFKDSIINVPLRLIESVESRDMFQLHIICKDSKVVRCHFSTFKQCQEWLKRLNRAVAHPGRLEDLFALAYHAWCLGGSADDEDQHLQLCRPGDHVRQRQEMEVRRMGFDMQNAWRVSDINLNYKLCSSYPQKLLVPVWITDKELESVGSFRSSKRIPVVVYRHQRNGAVIARCSQPEISWWGWRNTEDEYLVTSIAKACLMDPGARVTCGAAACSRPRGEGPDSSDGDFDSSLTRCSGPDANAAPQKLLILDARSYTAAVANRAKGGGCECEEYYPNCEVMFMGMANIHSIRNSFQSLRTVCSQIPDPGNWLSALESTRWLQHLSVMLKAATLVCSAVEREGRPVLVHCSDGWDRTPQIVALAKILLDPFYRTLEGFQVLVETEWLDYGHKFGDRCGHQESAEDVSEQCPVFLQWLDCVHQLLKQFPCFFEFNEAFLVKLVQHTYSCLYGTFLCNNGREREARNIYKRTCSIWSLLRTGNKNFQNFLYIPCHEMVLQPVCHTRALQLWTAVYLPTSSPCTAAEDAMELYLCPCIGICSPLCRLPKSRSMDNLVSACENGMALTRTSSDPNLNKHCQEGRTAHGLEPMAAIGGGAEPDSPEDVSPDTGLDDNDSEVEPVTPTPPTTPLEMEPREEGFEEEELREEICLTTQPLPYLRSMPTFPTCLEGPTTGSCSEWAYHQWPPEQPLSVCRAAGPRAASSSILYGHGRLHRDPHRQSRASPFSPPSPAYLDDDGLPVPMDAVQQRLRQIEAGYKQEVEVLRRQVRQLQMRLERQFLTSCFDFNSGFCLPYEWVPDHMASHCFNCDCEFWMAKRRHHCRNCGNVFCKDCCHLKLPIPDQQLYDPVLVCNVCYDLLLEARNREICSQQLKKPIATASS